MIREWHMVLFLFHFTSFIFKTLFECNVHYANFNSHISLPSVSFHCSSTDMTVILVFSNTYTYYADITLNQFTSIISISLSSNYTFPNDDVAQLHLSHMLLRDTHINYPLRYRRRA